MDFSGMAPVAADQQNRRGGGGRRSDYVAMTDDQVEMLLEQAQTVADAQLDAIETADRVAEALRVQQKVESDLVADREAATAAGVKAQEEQEAAIERVNEALAAQAAQYEKNIETIQKVKDTTSALGGVIDQVSGIVEAAAGADSRAAKAMEKVRGGVLMAEAIVNAAIEAARAAASFASQDYSGGALHTIAAAMFTAAAIKAGVEMGASSKSGSSSKSSGSARHEYTAPGRYGGYQEPTTKVVQFNGNFTSRAVQDDLDAAARDSSRQRAA